MDANSKDETFHVQQGNINNNGDDPTSMPLFGKQKFDEKVTNKFKLASIIGSGAFSDVYKGIEKSTGKEFAIKCVKKEDLDERIDALENEIAIHERLKHENIVELHQIFDNKNAIYLVMEIVTGGELLCQIIERGSYTEKDACILVKQLLQAVVYLHSVGVVHRDLKPENLLYHDPTEHSKIMIADFGLAKRTSDGPMTNACGTPGYIAPEVLVQKEYGRPVDMWAIGVITYILLCGYPPFYDEQDFLLYQQILRCDYEFESPYWDDISNGAQNFIKKLMDKEPDRRLTGEEALKDPWVCGEQALDIDIHVSFGEQIRKNFIKRKWKQAFNATTAIRRMKNLKI
eukprot:gene6097-6801_t